MPSAHSEAAKALAGDDLSEVYNLRCQVNVKPVARRTGPHVAHVPTPEQAVAVRIFDNMYYVGGPGVGATVIDTGDGLVLIDSLTTDAEVETYLLPGMKKFGLDLADVRYILITHAHGDHHGGVRLIRQLYPDIRVLMNEKDWVFASKPYFMGDGSPDPAPQLIRQPQDMGYHDDHVLTVGQTRFRLIETPGHTPGTSALLYNVQNGAQQETVFQWGGGHPERAEYSLETVERAIDAIKPARPTVMWSSHGSKIVESRLVSGVEGGNPFVDGAESMSRTLEVIRHCKRHLSAGT